jgi:hypothetical protein
MLDYDDNVTIKIIKVKDKITNEFSHWESEVEFSGNGYGSMCTGPTFYGVLDEAIDYMREVAQYWMSDDSNVR